MLYLCSYIKGAVQTLFLFFLLSFSLPVRACNVGMPFSFEQDWDTLPSYQCPYSPSYISKNSKLQLKKSSQIYPRKLGKGRISFSLDIILSVNIVKFGLVIISPKSLGLRVQENRRYCCIYFILLSSTLSRTLWAH